MADQWSNNQVCKTYFLQILDRFLKHNQCEVEGETIARGNRDAAHVAIWGDDTTVRNGFFWGIFIDVRFEFLQNEVAVHLPAEQHIRTDFIAMFEGAMTAWTGLGVYATQYIDFQTSQPSHTNGALHVVLDGLLVDYWDDGKTVAWQVKHPNLLCPCGNWCWDNWEAERLKQP